jgi:DNA-directed RNA polymerase subunit RPC12/RpoP
MSDNNTYYCQHCGIPFTVPNDWKSEYAGCRTCGGNSKVNDLKEAEKGENGQWLVSQDKIVPEGKIKFEVKMRKGNNDALEKAIFIDDELLDWSVDISSLIEAMKMGPKFYKSVQRDIEKHFTESVSEVLGRKVSAEEIKKATVMGWI